ncbi:hypothetical protein DFJ74DRAFT_672948 [Hyaloraphidium curvatum]|nr:hypothetical protein DFJ74DRAFT_672948 [Hyaloraphidium curvatum]
MWSRWPNNLTYDIISSLPFTPGGPLRTLEMQGPNLDLCGPPPYTTESQCWQFGSILIPLGDVCNVTGPYTFAFDTNCFPNSATSDCKGTKLFANAFIDGIDLCAGLMSTAGNVTGTLTVDKPQGYFFGDTVLLNATFESPDVPLYETRLMSFDAIIRKWKPDPVSVYTLQGGNGLFGRNANFSVVLDGLASPYSVLMHLTPNMMPKFEDGGFLTIEDFDTADNDFTFTLRFRVFFDPVSAGRTGLRRRSAARRRVYRDASLHFGRRQGGAIGSIREIAVGARSSMQVPNVTQALQTAPQMVPNGTVAAPPPQQQAAAAGTPVWAIVVGVLGGLLLLGGCCGGVAYLVIRRRDRKRKEAMGYSEKDPLVRSAAAYGGSDMLSPYAYAQAVGEKTGRPRSRASFSAPTGYVPTYTPPSAGGYSALELPVPPVTGAGGGGEMTWSGLGGDFVSRHASASWGTPADAVDVSGMFGAPAGAPSSSAPQVSTSADTVVDVSGMFGAQPPQPRASADWGGDRSASRSSGRSKRERH